MRPDPVLKGKKDWSDCEEFLNDKRNHGGKIHASGAVFAVGLSCKGRVGYENVLRSYCDKISVLFREI